MQETYPLARIQPSSPTPEIVLVRRRRDRPQQQATSAIHRFLHVEIAIHLCAHVW